VESPQQPGAPYVSRPRDHCPRTITIDRQNAARELKLNQERHMTRHTAPVDRHEHRTCIAMIAVIAFLTVAVKSGF
jgi:hypothetical protein